MTAFGNQLMSHHRSTSGEKEPIAIIGLGCRLPGGADDWRSFWEILESGADCITETPRERWNLQKFYSPIESLPGKTNSKWGGYVRGLDLFDPELFGISPREAASMDPQQRLLLETSFRAVEDAGWRIEQLSGQPIGIFVGISSFDYAMAGLSFTDRGVIGAYSNTGGSSSIAANRISYCFDLRGPSLAVDTACSSSLVAVHLACESIWRGESNMALAGGVNALILPDFYVAFSQLGVMSSDGKCRTFDAKAGGYVRSEGAGVLFLKPLRAALRDRDPIYAIIRGSALNQDGRTPGMTVPSQSAQVSLIRSACKNAGISPFDLQYIEAHGTGTQVGDPIEAAAIGTAVGQGRRADNACWVGSVKTNIGHLESGAGAASLIKVALALHHRRIPRNLHFDRSHPEIDLVSLGLRVPTTTVDWVSEGPRLAGINGFGYGGTNAHIIVEQAPSEADSVFSVVPSGTKSVQTRELSVRRNSELVERRAPAETESVNPAVRRAESVVGPPSPVLLPISARSPAALQQSVRQLADWIEAEGRNYHLAEIAGFLAHRRSHLDYRAAVCAGDSEEMVERLRILATSLGAGSDAEITSAQAKKGIAFVFAGQGSQWWAMGRGLLRYSPVFRSVIKRCDAELSQYASWSLLEELEKPESDSRMHLTSIAQPSIFAIQVGLTALWESWGVRPTAIVGHSVGEIAAAYAAGALTWEDACRVAFHRGRTMDLASSQGGMIAVGLSADEVQRWMDGIHDDVSIAAVNGPASVTVAGASEAINRLAERLETHNIFCRRLAVEYAFHSPQMSPVRDELLASLKTIQPKATNVQWISTVTGQLVDGRQANAEYWWRNVRQTVRFADAMIELAENGYELVVEVGPHPVLAYSINECFQAAGRSVRSIPSLNRQQSDLKCVSKSLGVLYSLGVDIQWSGFYNLPTRKLPIPTYPFQRQRLWCESAESYLLRMSGEAHPLLGQRADRAQLTWQQRIDLRLQSFLEDHRVRGSVVYPAACAVETVLAAAFQVACLDQTEKFQHDSSPGCTPVPQWRGIKLERLKLHSPCILSPEDPCWFETQYHAERNQVAMTFRRCKLSNGGLISAKDEETVALGSHSTTDDLLSWTPLASAIISSDPLRDEATEVQVNRIRSAQNRCSHEFTGQELYDYCAQLGLQYGPKFRGVVSGVQRPGEAVAEVELPATSDATNYLLHPALLDSCFHVMIAADASFDHALDGLYLPSEISEITFHGGNQSTGSQGSQPGKVIVHVRVLKKTNKRMWCDLDVTTLEGNLIIRLRGFESHRVQSSSTVETTRDLIYGYRWQLAEDPIRHQVGQLVNFSSKRANNHASQELNRHLDRHHSSDSHSSHDRSLNAGWLLFMDEGGVGKELSQRLREQGYSITEVYQSDSHVSQVNLSHASNSNFFQIHPERREDFIRMFSEWDAKALAGIVYLWGLDVPDTEGLTAETLRASTALSTLAPLHLVQAWEEICSSEDDSLPSHDSPDSSSTPVLAVVTRGAQVAHDPSGICQVAQAPLLGFGRVVISENGRLSTKLIDLPPLGQSRKVSAGDIDLLLNELLLEDAEDEVMLRNGQRWVQRFLPIGDEPLPGNANIDLPVQLRLGRSSGIEELRYETTATRALETGEIEIQVRAAGLNFSDVMKALDLYPGLKDSNVHLGAECSGRVARVASGSRWCVGDEVIAIAPGAFASHVIVNEQLVARKPANLTHEQAAAIPVAFLTAQHALHQCAKLKRGESILIHAASGGVGLAAIQLARAAGLRILATAGTPFKRDYLSRMGINNVMDSRSLDFGQQTLDATGGDGVDAILNSLPGPAIQTGLNILKIGGRFLEIGKRDIYDDAALGLYPFRKNLSLFAIDLDQLFQRQPARMGLLLQSLVQRFELGELQPLPITVYPADEAVSAFRFMQQAKHVGKVVVQYQNRPQQVMAGTYDAVSLRSDGTYWIVGGLGGFGLEIAKWMVSRGARHLVLSGRTPKLRPEAEMAIDQMQRAGAKITLLPTDVAQTSEVRKALAQIDSELPKLVGVVHSAMVLEDRLLVDLDRSTLERVLWPKVLGGWNLHQETRGRDLDLFIVFSSLSSIFGHAGQASYSAANAMLDSLAHYRRALGLPGMAINWGHLGQVGYLAERQQLGQRLERQGVLSFTVGQALDCLELALRTGATQLSVLRMDWSIWRGLGITGRVSPRFSHLIRTNDTGEPNSSEPVNPDQLRAVSPDQRMQIVGELLRGKIASLLGMSSAQVRNDRAPLEMGLDSLMAVELRNWIDAKMEISLKISVLMRSRSLNELIEHICELIVRSTMGESESAEPHSPATPQSSATRDFQHSNSQSSEGTEVGETNDTAGQSLSSRQAAELLNNLEHLSGDDVSRLLNQLLKK